jgi:DNA-directed RNA polymerase subunit beta'
MLDIVLGCYWMTKIIPKAKKAKEKFSQDQTALLLLMTSAKSLRAKIKVLPKNTPKYAQFDGKPFETSVGRLLFNGVLPKDYPYINTEINRKKMGQIVNDLIDRYGIENIPGNHGSHQRIRIQICDLLWCDLGN